LITIGKASYTLMDTKISECILDKNKFNIQRLVNLPIIRGISLKSKDI
jgi:hypothetical protein